MTPDEHAEFDRLLDAHPQNLTMRHGLERLMLKVINRVTNEKDIERCEQVNGLLAHYESQGTNRAHGPQGN